MAHLYSLTLIGRLCESLFVVVVARVLPISVNAFHLHSYIYLLFIIILFLDLVNSIGNTQKSTLHGATFSLVEINWHQMQENERSTAQKMIRL